MSKGDIVYGNKSFGIELEKLINGHDITLVTHDHKLLETIELLSYLSRCKTITLLVNRPHEEDLIRQKDRTSFIDELVTGETLEYTLNSRLVAGMNVVNNFRKTNRIQILISNTSGTGGIAVLSKSDKVEFILVSSRIGDNETVSIVKYLPGEPIDNTILNDIQYKINQSGRNVVDSVISSYTEHLKIDENFENLYNKSLYELSKHYLHSKEIESLNKINKSEFKFQSDGVDALISIISKYGIAYLADSVGLGKTIITLRLLAKTRFKAIVVTPSELVMNQWQECIEDSDIDIYDTIRFCINSYQSMGKLVETVSDYDIVVFDEAHNFRNMNTMRYQKAQELCSGKIVLLLGATPINNSLEDIRAQLLLGLDPNKSYDFGVGAIGDYFDTLKKEIPASKKDIIKFKAAQEKVGIQVRNHIISKLMIRRTRQDIIKYYDEDIKSGKLHFPEIEKPVIVRYEYSGIKLSRTLDILSGYNFSCKLTFAIYNKDVYKTTQAVEAGEADHPRETNFTGFTKSRLIKLLDSSVDAFVNSLMKMLNTIENEIQQVQYFNTSYYSDKYLEDLINDRNVIIEILKMWVNKDGLVEASIKPEAVHNIIKEYPDEKIVIFTEFIDSAESLAKYLSNKGYKVLKIDGNDKRSKTTELRDNFSLTGRMLDNYNILISTNVLSEGINLNRASIAINYDITWNPTVIIQRVGRLNRVDSVVRRIKVFNFFPCDTVDTAILSESNIISKYVLANYSIGSDENYLTNDEESMQSMMEYKQDIISSISNSIRDESLDFKTVDFYFVDEAIQKFSDKAICEIVQSRTSYVNTINSNGSEQPKAMGLFKIGNKYSVYQFDKTGFKFLEFSDFISQISKLSQYETIETNQKVYNALNKLVEQFKIESRFSCEMSKTQKNFYNVINRLQDNLDEAVDKQELSDLVTFKIQSTLDKIKSSIKSGYMSEYLCKHYNKSFIDMIETSNIGALNQAETLIKLIPKRFYTDQFYSKRQQNGVELVVFLCVL